MDHLGLPTRAETEWRRDLEEQNGDAGRTIQPKAHSCCHPHRTLFLYLIAVRTIII